jgi:Ca2+-binding EF-hand superfamily protein
MWADRKAKDLAAYDANKDGKLDERERATMHQARMDERFAELDTDKNGSLSRAEANQPCGLANRFDAIDADKNGTVTLAEIQASMKKMARETHKRAAERFKAADTDNDGSLTREEAKAMPNVAKNFDAIDADKSGTVTGKEIHDYMRAHRQQRKKG